MQSLRRNTRPVLPPQGRRGAVLVESAVVLSTLLIILLGMLDLGLAVLQYNTLAEASRKLSRSAAVHGARCAPRQHMWGPTTYSGNAADGSEPAAAVKDLLVTMQKANVTLRLEWPDGDNAVGKKVTATVSTTYRPMFSWIIKRQTIPLSASSTIKVSH